MLRILFVLIFLASASIGGVNSHEESGEWSCGSNSEIHVPVEFKPGLITLDGHADDWKDIDGSEFSLLPALDPDAENEYKGGKMTVKVLFVFPFELDGIIRNQYLSELSLAAQLPVNHYVFHTVIMVYCRVCMTVGIFSFCFKLMVPMLTLKGKPWPGKKPIRVHEFHLFPSR